MPGTICHPRNYWTGASEGDQGRDLRDHFRGHLSQPRIHRDQLRSAIASMTFLPSARSLRRKSRHCSPRLPGSSATAFPMPSASTFSWAVPYNSDLSGRRPRCRRCGPHRRHLVPNVFRRAADHTRGGAGVRSEGHSSRCIRTASTTRLGRIILVVVAGAIPWLARGNHESPCSAGASRCHGGQRADPDRGRRHRHRHSRGGALCAAAADLAPACRS